MAFLPAPSDTIYQTPKCFITYGTHSHVDGSQQVSKKTKPWSTLCDLGFIQKVDLLMPQECLASLRAKLNERSPPSFSRVSMTLGDVLEREFLTEYVKRRDVLMISWGKKMVDDMFTLQEGTLTLYLGKETYEKAGLVGAPYGAKGGRKLKPRWVVNFDLKSDTMIHGKKGFDRLIYACKQVFNKPVTWLFCNIDGNPPNPDPLAKHEPETTVVSRSFVENVHATKIPVSIEQDIVAQGDRTALEEAANDLYEWISLARLGSLRIVQGDKIDPYLARYEAPGATNEGMSICKVSFTGLLSASWLRELATDIMAILPSRSWFALSATELSASLSGAAREVTLLRPEELKDEYLLWEIRSAE